LQFFCRRVTGIAMGQGVKTLCGVKDDGCADARAKHVAQNNAARHGLN
jgi:hypothetical protein